MKSNIEIIKYDFNCINVNKGKETMGNIYINDKEFCYEGLFPIELREIANYCEQQTRENHDKSPKT